VWALHGVGVIDDITAAFTIPRLLSVARVAEVLGCSGPTVRRRITAGLLPAVTEGKQIKVRGDDLRDYIDGLDQAGAARARPRGRQTSRDYPFLRD
jgi:excisionase family DNA binding protein